MAVIDPFSPEGMTAIGGLISGLLAGLIGYARGKKAEPQTEVTKDVAISAVGITDMRPIREMVLELRRVADTMEKFFGFLKEQAQDEERKRALHEEARLAISELMERQEAERRRAGIEEERRRDGRR